ncbi:hypothetical protein QC762_113465 [Podospora pseudocomata]|uniref:Uncharacterized protein n=1 Tax=Podospora pseudocomata TaxID=2093779 RepID=A0ABR0GW27_9PEZI|nr:hypothetical protein QC762_113465 [Podospora pseudocomata]
MSRQILSRPTNLQPPPFGVTTLSISDSPYLHYLKPLRGIPQNVMGFVHQRHQAPPASASWKR